LGVIGLLYSNAFLNFFLGLGGLCADVRHNDTVAIRLITTRALSTSYVIFPRFLRHPSLEAPYSRRS